MYCIPGGSSVRVLHHSLSSSFRCVVMYVISFVLQVLLLRCIFFMRWLHQCRLERRALSVGTQYCTLKSYAQGCFWVILGQVNTWSRLRAVVGGVTGTPIFWEGSRALALPFLCRPGSSRVRSGGKRQRLQDSAWQLICSLISASSSHIPG